MRCWRVALDDPLQGILPELSPGPPISLRQLLNYTAGIPDYGGSPAYNGDLRADSGKPWTQDEFLMRTLEGGPLLAWGGMGVFERWVHGGQSGRGA